MSAVVRELYVYPFKSARAVPKQHVRLGATGIEWDRHWMAANRDGVFMSQRTQPRLARIVPEIGEDALTLHAPDLEPLTLPLQPAGDARPARVWDDTVTALDQGDTASAWLSRAVGEEARLLRISPVLDRRASARYAGANPPPVTFVDGFPLLIVNLASLDALNARMPDPVPLERFRPNVVLEGLEPFAEDRIDAIHIGPVTLRLVKPCTRCVITATDQRTGEPSTNPLPVLRQFRFDRTLKGVKFGENAIITAGVGQILERGARCTVVYDA
ncbi:MAG: MOSC N-terminal beta barrel domain-containing protein [Steroidobacteraceae bacterium]|nr:MOSC N-terminal beta barrel domain-containing protein [Steroidobacteraceae bacterium]